MTGKTLETCIIPREPSDLAVCDATHEGFTLVCGELRFPCTYEFSVPRPVPPPGEPVRDPRHGNVAVSVHDEDGRFIDMACGSNMARAVVLSDFHAEAALQALLASLAGR